MPTEPSRHRDGVDVARVLDLAFVVLNHLSLAVIGRPHGHVRGTNLLRLHPGLALLTAAAPMPVFFAAGGYANATATLAGAARRLRALAGIGTVVVLAWSAAVAVAVLTSGEAGIVGRGARITTQPLWFVAAYAPFAAAGGWAAVLGVTGVLAAASARIRRDLPAAGGDGGAGGTRCGDDGCRRRRRRPRGTAVPAPRRRVVCAVPGRLAPAVGTGTARCTLPTYWSVG